MVSHKLYRYAVDTFNGRFINGWCFHRLFKNRRLVLRVVGDGQLLGTTETSEYRKDLLKAGLHPTGVCGFDFSFSSEFYPHRYNVLELFVENHPHPLISLPGKEIERLGVPSDKQIFFMHIPKTAGSSFNAFLRRCFSGEESVFHLEREEKERSETIVHEKQCVSGHLPWYDIKTLTEGSSFQFYSLVREPYNHLQSHLNYVRRVFTQGEDESLYGYQHNDAIKALGEKLSGVDFSDTAQTRTFVAGMNGYEFDFFDNIQTRYFLDYRPSKVEQQDLERALEIVEVFEDVGLTESYQQFVDRFCQSVGIPKPKLLQQANIADHYHLFTREDISPEAPLYELVSFDLQLYEALQKRFAWQRDP